MQKLGFSLLLATAALTWCRADQVTIQQGQRVLGRERSNAEIQRDAQRWSSPGSVGTTPMMFSLVTPAQAPQANWDVKGHRLSIFYGECVNFDGFDLSVLVGRATGHGNGLHIAGIANIIDGSSVGFQVAPVNVVGGGFAGMQIGVANYAGYLPGSVGKGWQIGAFNGATNFQGFQLGVINYTETMLGVQIGLVNIIERGYVPFMPIFNASF
jgi:hypothetical protein